MGLSGAEWLSFAGIVLLLVMFPGPNTVLVLQSVGVSGRKTGFFNVAGIVAALYLHAAVSVLGLSVILAGSAELYTAVKWLGAGYIVYLGVSGIYGVWRQPPLGGEQPLEPVKAVLDPAFSAFIKGLVSNLLNPKVALFFLSFFPQFIRHQDQLFAETLMLTVAYSLISATWYSLLVLFVDRLRFWLQNPLVQRRIKILSGLLLCGLGAKMLWQR